jgi:hypothetical protein
LNRQPEWYNAVTNNCTTNIAVAAAEAQHKQVRWDWRILLNGKMDEMMYEYGTLVTGGLSLPALKAQAHINAVRGGRQSGVVEADSRRKSGLQRAGRGGPSFPRFPVFPDGNTGKKRKEASAPDRGNKRLIRHRQQEDYGRLSRYTALFGRQ